MENRKALLISKSASTPQQIHQPRLLSKNNYAYHNIEKIKQVEKALNTTPRDCILFDLDSISADTGPSEEI